MELYQLRAFVKVADEGNLTRAAKLLHASQPAISAQIKTLEEELGVALFLRTPQGMTLTDDGLRLRARALQILTLVVEMEQEAARMQEVLKGELRIGINAEPGLLRIGELFAAMQARYPGVKINLLQTMTGEVPARLESGDLDAGFMFGEVASERLHLCRLGEFEMVIAGAPRLEEMLAAATPRQLADCAWIMTPDDCPFHAVASSFFSRHEIEPKQAALIDDESVIRLMVKNGVGLAFLLRQDAAGKNEAERLAIWDKEAMSLPLSIGCLRRRKTERIMQTLCAALETVWKDDGLRASD